MFQTCTENEFNMQMAKYVSYPIYKKQKKKKRQKYAKILEPWNKHVCNRKFSADLMFYANCITATFR